MTPTGFDALPIIWDAAVKSAGMVGICLAVLAGLVVVAAVVNGRRA